MGTIKCEKQKNEPVECKAFIALTQWGARKPI